MQSPYQGNASGFTIQGFSDNPEMQLLLFLVFLSIYLFILLGNLTVILVISLNSHLNTPMYLLLLTLSFNDISSTTNILPTLLHILFTQQKNISFLGCITQVYVYMSLLMYQYTLLTIMAYDRYVAICDPLRYIVRMAQNRCAKLITGSLVVSFFYPIGHTILIAKFSYCGSHVIDHFFCDVTPLLKLLCREIFTVQLLTFIEGTLVIFICVLPLLISYIFIIMTILKIHSSEGRKKTFSTCASHLSSVILFYGTVVSLYVRPTTSYCPKKEKFFALLHIVLIPLLNPLIYTLKNKEFQSAFIQLTLANEKQIHL